MSADTVTKVFSFKSLADHLDDMGYKLVMGFAPYAGIDRELTSYAQGPMHVHFRAAKSLLVQAEQSLMLAHYEHEKLMADVDKKA